MGFYDNVLRPLMEIILVFVGGPIFLYLIWKIRNAAEIKAVAFEQLDASFKNLNTTIQNHTSTLMQSGDHLIVAVQSHASTMNDSNEQLKQVNIRLGYVLKKVEEYDATRRLDYVLRIADFYRSEVVPVQDKLRDVIIKLEYENGSGEQSKCESDEFEREAFEAYRFDINEWLVTCESLARFIKFSNVDDETVFCLIGPDLCRTWGMILRYVKIENRHKLIEDLYIRWAAKNLPIKNAIEKGS